MKVNASRAVPSKSVEMPGAHACSVRWLLSESDGTPTFAMREFEVAPGGYTPRHSHDYEHEVFVLSGSGVVLEGDKQHQLSAGDVVFVQPNEVHQFRNTGTQAMRFLCLIPNSATGKTVTVAPECGTQ
ncbi:MAG TPA: cupin domain-containing protein [Pirellulales bacterium]|jgi:quercetin dioxygenase-like cupin family protein|nr:cupin domain-containing protein [Pirellulales bacterium]